MTCPASIYTTHAKFFIALFLSQSHAAFGAEVFFSPGPDCETKISQAIDKSKSEIQVAVYAINNSRIVSSLIAAKERGVKIRILTDAIQASGRSSRVLDLLDDGLDVRVHSKYKIMHNKFGIFDHESAVSGSYNWTRPASSDNAENCIYFTESNVVEAYNRNFEELWKLNPANRSTRKLAKIRLRNRAIAREEMTRRRKDTEDSLQKRPNSH